MNRALKLQPLTLILSPEGRGKGKGAFSLIYG